MTYFEFFLTEATTTKRLRTCFVWCNFSVCDLSSHFCLQAVGPENYLHFHYECSTPCRRRVKQLIYFLLAGFGGNRWARLAEPLNQNKVTCRRAAPGPYSPALLLLCWAFLWGPKQKWAAVCSSQNTALFFTFPFFWMKQTFQSRFAYMYDTCLLSTTREWVCSLCAFSDKLIPLII